MNADEKDSINKFSDSGSAVIAVIRVQKMHKSQTDPYDFLCFYVVDRTRAGQITESGVESSTLTGNCVHLYLRRLRSLPHP